METEGISQLNQKLIRKRNKVKASHLRAEDPQRKTTRPLLPVSQEREPAELHQQELETSSEGNRKPVFASQGQMTSGKDTEAQVSPSCKTNKSKAAKTKKGASEERGLKQGGVAMGRKARIVGSEHRH